MTIVDIFELLEKRTKYALRSSFTDEWYNELTEDMNIKEKYFVCTKSFFEHSQVRNRNETKELFNNYKVSAIFDIADPYFGTSTNFQFIKFTKKSVEKVKISNYVVDVKKDRIREVTRGYFILAIENDIKYKQYILSLNNWINRNEKKEEDYYEFTEIETDKMEVLTCSAYSKNNLKIVDMLANAKTTKLGELADIISSSKKNNGLQKTMFNRDMTYPLNIDKIALDDRGTVKIKKGDILISTAGSQKVYLFDEDIDNIYANRNIVVIRPNKILSEYLYIYLTSDLIKQYILNSQKGCAIGFITLSTVKELPIIEPEREEKEYIELFKKAVYSPKEISDYYSTINFSKPDINDVDDILKLERLKGIKDIKNLNVRKIIEEDIKELNSCYNVKAYKATLILAGSILEAVLLDWLTEKHQKGYFKEENRIKLSKCINEIKEIKKPEWMDEYEKAEEIRDRRNLVHAKLCLKENVKIDGETCKKVISYLEDVIKSRTEEMI